LKSSAGNLTHNTVFEARASNGSYLVFIRAEGHIRVATGGRPIQTPSRGLACRGAVTGGCASRRWAGKEGSAQAVGILIFANTVLTRETPWTTKKPVKITSN
jgi:hypothetical protein